MSTLTLLSLWTVALSALCYHRASIKFSTVVVGLGLIATTLTLETTFKSITLMFALYGLSALVLNHPPLRLRFVSKPLMMYVKNTTPKMSQTEKTALEAGSVWWEKELFTGNPNWEILNSVPKPKLTQEEAIFIEKQVETLCSMIEDYDVAQNNKDLPPSVWEFLKNEGFFSLIIPKEYGGLEFSAYAQSQILSKIGSHSLTLATTVSVPNSLGPAELLMHYGTDVQKSYYLPRLAKGIEIPCFALTGPEAGSDAGSIPDKGIICYGQFNGKEVLGIKLNWNKRYITLAPVATVLGLAFKLYDYDHILGEKESLGITCALIPVDLEGIHIGNRHMPIGSPFQNGPTTGKNVFIPIDYIIGGPKMAGQGWRMLVECLSAGRAISLPSCASGCAKMGAFSSGAYSRVRVQFGNPIAQFEGIQEALGRIGGLTYLSEATRTITANAICQGEKPTVAGAISKYHVTEINRKVLIDAMDIHGGKAIMQGPLNYLANAYQGAPIAITVEGANILTRNMIIFGQGAIRCHPYILKEMESAQIEDAVAFDHFLMEHIGFTLSNMVRAVFHPLTFNVFCYAPYEGQTKPYYKNIVRASAAFALVADLTMLILGGKLKFKENISAKLGDLLSMMYLNSCVLKHFDNQGSPTEDLPLLQWTSQYCMSQYWDQMGALLDNYPSKIVGIFLKCIIMPFGSRVKPPKDKLTRTLADMLSTDNPSRSRLLEGLYIGKDNENLAVLNKTFYLTLECAPIIQRVQKAIAKNQIPKGSFAESIVLAKTQHIISDYEEKCLLDLEIYKQKVIKVDDFDKSFFIDTLNKMDNSWNTQLVETSTHEPEST